jgi:hypothetical protein
MLKPSRVDVPAPAPVMLVPINIALATDKPPERTTAPLPTAEVSVVLVNVTAPEAARVVNAPVFAVVLPIGVLLIEPPVTVGDVNVLLVNVSAPSRVATVPVVGSVMLVFAVVVNVKVCAPL